MKTPKSVKCTILFLSVGLMLQAQTFKKTEGQASYWSSYEGKTLSPAENPELLPYNRWVEPAGKQVYFGDPGLENHALDVVFSPDKKWLAVEGRYEILILSPKTYEIVATLNVSSVLKDAGIMNTFSGICWAMDNGSYKLYWGTSSYNNTSYVMQASWDNIKLAASDFYLFEAAKPATVAIPNEVLVLKENGKSYLYVVLNGNNELVKIDLATKQRLWTSKVGVAPFGITEANGKLYVTNWAGSVPDSSDTNVAGVPWGLSKVDPVTGATREGTVSVIDPKSGSVLKTIQVGLHPNDIIRSNDSKFIYVANANSDDVSVISTATDMVCETIPVRLTPEQNKYWGDSPNGLAIAPDNKVLYVANGMDNALAVVELGLKSCSGSALENSGVKGFIPTGAYPGAIAISGKQELVVANIEAEGAQVAHHTEGTTNLTYNSHKMLASVSVIPAPSQKKLAAYTKKVSSMQQFFRLALTEQAPRSGVAPVPVPERIGEPSVFKHVLYIIKENRTYDQVLGDMKKGDGDSTLAIFGRQITPNTHALCNDYLLLDNFYASGKCSAEGHQWTDASIVTDYVEKDVRAWFRSYPHVQEDALVYAPTGFLWDNALKNNKNVRIYGEASTPEYDQKHTWTSIYNGFLNHEKFEFKNKTTISSVEKILSETYPSYDDHRIPDALRADAFINELKAYENMEGDQLPELMMMALPCDHTGGTREGLPTPRAMVADNDLALGQIIEAISKSRFWKNTVVFVTEDDSQSGWDHVSAYRTVGMIISPYTKTGAVIHTNYNQPSMVRTIEQILGIPPMNVMDATAMPMFDCFSLQADNSPYQALENQIPLNEMNPKMSGLKGDALYYARKSMEPQFDGIDTGDDDLFNRILWFAMKGNEKYPKRYSGKDLD